MIADHKPTPLTTTRVCPDPRGTLVITAMNDPDKPSAHVTAFVHTKKYVCADHVGFFEELLSALVEFGAVLLDGPRPGVVFDIRGSLDELRGHSSIAATCADAVEVIARVTASQMHPMLRISLAFEDESGIVPTSDAAMLLHTGLSVVDMLETVFACVRDVRQPADTFEIVQTIMSGLWARASVRRGVCPRISSPDVNDAPPRSSTTPMIDSERLFEERIIAWAQSSGLFDSTSECPGASNYIRTAYRLFSDERIADLVARYMILVAVGDVLFDERLPRETQAEHAERLLVSATYLQRVLSTGLTKDPPPNVFGRQTLETIARQWCVMINEVATDASSILLEHWRCALSRHYEDSVREYLPDVVENPLIDTLQSGHEPPHAGEMQILGEYISAAPIVVASRIQELEQVCLSETQDKREKYAAITELRVWLYLLDVNTIGAALAFRTAALAIPADAVPPSGIAALERVLPLLDFQVRLANDASDFVKNMGNDRDTGKTNSCAILLRQTQLGQTPAELMMRAVRTIRHVRHHLRVAFAVEIQHLTATWPLVGHWVTRGCKLGTRAYEVGHYTSLDRNAFTALLKAS